MDIDITGNYAQLPRMLLTPMFDVTVEGRGTGKSYDMGFCMDRLIRNMPKGVFSLTGKTYGQLLTRTLPSALKVLDEMGYQKDVNYVIGRKPPTWFIDSYEKLSKFDNVISFANGAKFLMTSQSEKGSGRGANTDFELMDEALTIDIEQYNYEVVPTNRGNTQYFKHVPFHHGLKYSTSMPPTKQGRWVLDYASYYEQERGIPIFSIWNQIVQMQIELLSIENPKHFSQLWNEIQRVRAKITPFVSQKGVLFTLANAFDNLHNVGLKYIKNNKEKLPSLIFMVEIMNYLFDKVEDCFYNINEAKQLYYDTDNKSLLQNAMDCNFNFELMAQKASTADVDCNTALPLELVADWGASICLFCVCQERNFDFVTNQRTDRTCQTFINEFFVKPNETDNVMIEELCRKFTDYYQSHHKKTIHYYRDRHGDSRNPSQLNAQSYNEQAIKVLKQAGWTVIEHVHRGQEPPQSDKYLLWGMILKETDPLLPLVRFNATKCKYTLFSMNNARLKDDNGKLTKDKSSERKTSGTPQEEATHFSDAADKIVYTKFQDIIKEKETFIPARIPT